MKPHVQYHRRLRIARFKFYRNLFLGIIILFFLLGAVGLLSAYPTCEEPDYLWLEFGERRTDKKGNYIQPVAFFFGQFPGHKGGIQGLDTFKVFCSLGERNDKGQELFYRINTITENRKSNIFFNSKESSWYKIIATGEKEANGCRYSYAGEMVFCFFGNPAVIKHGKDNFKKEIIETCNSENELNNREIYWINHQKLG